MVGAHEIELYASAAVVVGAGQPLLIGLSATPRGERSPVRILSAIWCRRPWATATVMVVMVAMIVLQYTVHGLSDQLMRQPGALRDGRWWRVFTALFIQSSGLIQIVVNVGALAVAGPIAERVLGPRSWLLVFFGSGLVANIVSEAGWSRHGGGDSVAICGLVGALAAVCLLRVGEFGSDHVKNPGHLRLTALAIPAAGTFLCAISNNHGVGLLTGFVFGLAVATTCQGFPDLGPAKTAVEENSLSGGLAVM